MGVPPVFEVIWLVACVQEYHAPVFLRRVDVGVVVVLGRRVELHAEGVHLVGENGGFCRVPAVVYRVADAVVVVADDAVDRH